MPHYAAYGILISWPGISLGHEQQESTKIWPLDCQEMA